MEGVFIALDGSDPSITEVQFGLLAKNLREAGHNVELFDFTRYDQPSGHFVREYKRGRYGSDEDVGPYTGSLFYALDQYHAAPQIRDAVKAGKVVLAHHYTGSTMAEQGQKFVRPEERRGFFLWLESMETRMFGLPRPAASIVLRDPAGTAKTDYPSLLTEAYDDLCQLFSKDYWRLDVARSDKILPEETIQSLILAKITPLLPPLDAPRAISGQPDHKVPYNGSSAMATTGHTVQVSLSVSDLLASVINDECRILMRVETAGPQHTGRRYYIPKELDKSTESAYKEHFDRIFDIHDIMADKLSAREGVRARQILNAVLPVAATSQVSFEMTTSELSGLIKRLGTIPGTEASDVVHQLTKYASPGTGLPVTPNPNAQAGQTTAPQNMADLSTEYLASTYAAGDPQVVDLTDIWPRNELEIVPHMLFAYSSLPLKDIRQSVSTWSYEQKAEVMRAYIDAHMANVRSYQDALQMVRYGWDLLCDYGAFRDLQQLGEVEYLARQPLTPRYGFDIPDEVEEAGLLDEFEECFAISLKLHSILQQAGYGQQSQYATLRGHKLRAQMTLNAIQAFKLFDQHSPDSKRFRDITSPMLDRLSEYHPMIAEAMRRTEETTDQR